MNTIISVNSLLFRNFIGLLACLGIFIGATLFLANNWPPVINFEWFFLPVLSLVSLSGIFCFSLWVLFPRNFKIKIDEQNVQISEKTYFKTNIRNFDVTKIVSINHIVDCGSFIKMNNGKEHRINDMLMIKKAEIFKIVAKLHPHIKCNSDEVHLF
jgi:hypothetical protein